MMASLALLQVHNPILLMVQVLVFFCVVAVVIILGRWLLSLSGWVIPQPLMAVFGIIAFIVLLLVFLNFIGVWHL